MKFITKQFLIVFFLLSFLIGGGLQWYKISSICGFDIGDMCGEVLFQTKLITNFIFVVLFPILLVILFPNSVFESWRRFIIWAVPLMAIITIIAANLPGGGGLPGQFHPSALILPPLYLMYFLASLIIILRAWQKSRKNNSNT